MEYIHHELEKKFIFGLKVNRLVALSEEARLTIRQEKEAPIIDELIEKIKYKIMVKKIVPKSTLHQSMGYFTLLIHHLKNYTKYPRG